MEPIKINRDERSRFSAGNGRYTKVVIFLLAVFGVVMLVLKAVAWGASHQVIIQKPWDFSTKPMVVIKDIEPLVIVSPIVDKLEDIEQFTSVEQKIIEKWGYRNGIIAIAVAACESGMDQYAVSSAGALGLFQIHWAAHGDKVRALGRTSADLLTDIDFNIEMAYTIWSNAGEAWHDWDVFNSGAYLSCLQ